MPIKYFFVLNINKSFTSIHILNQVIIKIKGVCYTCYVLMGYRKDVFFYLIKLIT